VQAGFSVGVGQPGLLIIEFEADIHNSIAVTSSKVYFIIGAPASRWCIGPNMTVAISIIETSSSGLPNKSTGTLPILHRLIALG
jgi:hypothetical protein